MDQFQLPPSVSGGTIELVLSNSRSARIYDDAGHLLKDRAAAVGGSDYLAGLVNGNLDVYIEGLQADPDFSLTYEYLDAGGNVQASVSVHIVIADLTFVDANGNNDAYLPG